MIDIVEFDEHDYSKIVVLNKTIFGPIVKKQKLYTEENMKERLATKKSIMLGAKYQNKLVGYIVGYFEKKGFYLWLWGVRKEYRRNGIYSALLFKLEEILKPHKVEKIFAKLFSNMTDSLICHLKKGYVVVKAFKSRREPSFYEIILEKKF